LVVFFIIYINEARSNKYRDCNVAVHLPAAGVSRLQPYTMIGRTAVKRNRFETFAAQRGAIPVRDFRNEGDGGYLESGHCGVSGIPRKDLPHTCLVCYRYTIFWVRTTSLFSKVPNRNLIAGTHQHKTVNTVYMLHKSEG
jgi:hypothetical protein